MSGASSDQFTIGLTDAPTPSLVASPETPSEPPTLNDDDLPEAAGPQAVVGAGDFGSPGLPVRTTWDPSPPSPQPPPPTTKPVEFLLVDDNPINLKMISHHMKKLGHSFDTATDGKKAFEAVQASGGQYKCIFMDISMPNMDGFESTRLVRAFEREKHLPRCQIFALTGIASESAQQEAFASGIDLFLTKPVKLKELNRILEEKTLA